MSNIYIYSDESGTFDYKHCEYFVYGGIVFLSKKDRDQASREYVALEKILRETIFDGSQEEIKANKLTLKEKRRLLSVSKKPYSYRFAIITHSPSLRQKDNISNNPKTKQRYLDWAYKMGIKKVVKHLIENKKMIQVPAMRFIFS